MTRQNKGFGESREKALKENKVGSSFVKTTPRYLQQSLRMFQIGSYWDVPFDRLPAGRNVSNFDNSANKLIPPKEALKLILLDLAEKSSKSNWIGGLGCYFPEDETEHLKFFLNENPSFFDDQIFF